RHRKLSGDARVESLGGLSQDDGALRGEIEAVAVVSRSPDCGQRNPGPQFSPAAAVRLTWLSVGFHERAHRDADDMADAVDWRRRSKIEQYRLEQRRLTRVNQLRGGDLTILDHERSGAHLRLQILGKPFDAVGGTGFVERLADLR